MLKQYEISVDYEVIGYNKKGNIFIALYHVLKNINKGAKIEIRDWED